jgi:hypothetical protein
MSINCFGENLRMTLLMLMLMLMLMLNQCLIITLKFSYDLST